MRFFRRRPKGPDLSPETVRRLGILFAPEDRPRAATLLRDQCGQNLPGLSQCDMFHLERFRFAALKYSDGKLLLLEGAVRLANEDWRDLLMAAGFGYDAEAHARWEPKPAGEPAEIDPIALRAGIHGHLALTLVPLGFARTADDWRRETSGGVGQSFEVATGLTSRVETRFFLRIRIDGGAKPVVTQMPRHKPEGYVFRAGDSEEVLYAAVSRDAIRYAQPWLLRFATPDEVQRGFEDKTFDPYVDVEGCALIF